MGIRRRTYVGALMTAAAAAGLMAGARWAAATSPVGETSPPGRAEYPASVYYDEQWAAAGAIATSAAGFQFVDPTKGPVSQVAGVIRKGADGKWTTSVHPRMVVTRWRVHGHIHFQ